MSEIPCAEPGSRHSFDFKRLKAIILVGPFVMLGHDHRISEHISPRVIKAVINWQEGFVPIEEPHCDSEEGNPKEMEEALFITEGGFMIRFCALMLTATQKANLIEVVKQCLDNLGVKLPASISPVCDMENPPLVCEYTSPRITVGGGDEKLLSQKTVDQAVDKILARGYHRHSFTRAQEQQVFDKLSAILNAAGRTVRFVEKSDNPTQSI